MDDLYQKSKQFNNHNANLILGLPIPCSIYQHQDAIHRKRIRSITHPTQLHYVIALPCSEYYTAYRVSHFILNTMIIETR